MIPLCDCACGDGATDPAKRTTSSGGSGVRSDEADGGGRRCQPWSGD